jgi:ribosome-associated toxin RatA of RatAB toxin-antitoxin module
LATFSILARLRAPTDSVADMAVSDSKEVVIEASPDEVLEVIADVESAPEWSPAQQQVEVVDTDAEGRPHRVKMKVKSVGITDECVVEYTWADNVISWSLVSSSAHKRQDASYTLIPEADKTRVKFQLTVDPKIPVPGFVMKRAIKGAMNDATEGLRKRVLSLKKGGR